MSIELVKALILIVKYCADQSSCNTCVLRDFCGKIPSEWE